MTLDAPSTFAFAAGILLVGEAIRRAVPSFARFALPTPVLSGLLFALAAWWFLWRDGRELVVDVSYRAELQSLFFAVVGFSTTPAVVGKAARRVLLLWSLAVVAGCLQNLVGVLLAWLLGEPLALGVALGSVSLMGSPALGQFFSGPLEAAGVAGAGPLCAAASAMGIIAASLLANPVASAFVRRSPLAPVPSAPSFGQMASYGVLAGLLSVAGLIASRWLGWVGVMIPSFASTLLLGVGARQLVAAHSKWEVNSAALGRLGLLFSSLFLAHAMMDLRLEQLMPLRPAVVVVLSVQILWIFAAAAALLHGRVLGSGYEAAVSMAGFQGFGLGITPNVVANMSTLGRRFGPAPESMVAVPFLSACLVEPTARWVAWVWLAWLQK